MPVSEGLNHRHRTDAPDRAREYAEWVLSHRNQVPQWFPVDKAPEIFSDTYPFHPTLLSVFERKWQALPRFQQTRGILRLLALWVSHAYQAGFKGAHKDPLIGMGTAPLDDPMFRSAVFEQLGGVQLEGAVTTDICGSKGSHSLRLDKEAVDTIRKARLHQKVSTVIFFESNGGQTKTEATLPEIRLAVAEPDLDIGNIETALETLTDTCYFLSAEKNRYRFSLSPNLNKLLSDRRASIQPTRVEDRIRAEVQKVFREGNGVDRIFFPDKSNLITDRATLALVVLPPDRAISDPGTRTFIDTATREHGTSSRTYKSALLWAVPEGPNALRDDARKVLAWEDLADEQSELRLDEGQTRQLNESQKKAQRDIKETVWRTYKNVMLLDKNNAWRTVDFGLVHSSAADSLVTLILKRLRQDGDIADGVSPNFLTRNWPPAYKEWSTKSVRDAFFASPQFPRLLNGDVIKDTFIRGVENGLLGYVGKKADGSYFPFHWQTSLSILDIEISDDMFVIQREVAEAYISGLKSPTPTQSPSEPSPDIHPTPTSEGDFKATSTPPELEPSIIETFHWQGEIPSQKWMNFYTKVLAKFAAGAKLKLRLNVEVSSENGIPPQKIEETKVALRELGLADTVTLEQPQKEHP